VDAVLFDLDGTLCTYRVSGQAVIEGAFEAIGVEPCFSVADYHRVWDRDIGESDDLRDLRLRCFSDLVEAAGHDPELGVELEAAYDARRDPADVRALPGAREAVRALAGEYPLGLVTNGHPEPQRAKLAAIGLEATFESVVFGGYDVPAKPAPDPFERVLADLGVEPARAVHVGNSLASDVAGARAAGLTSVWLREPDATAKPVASPDHVVDSLSALVERPWSTSS
jgi:putative hydrolase of the HAD superfamily